MMAAHDVSLARARLDHLQHVLDGVLEGALFALLPGEVTEGAGQHADIGRIHVPVEDEEDLLSVPARLGEVGHPPEAVEILRLEEEKTVFPGEPLAGAHLVPERRQARVSEEGRTSIGSEHETSWDGVQTDRSV